MAAHRVPPASESPHEPRLTPREAEVLEAVLSRWTNGEIAGEFGVSKRTIETHVASLLSKFGASNRQQLRAFGLARRHLHGAAASHPGRATTELPLISSNAEIVVGTRADRYAAEDAVRRRAREVMARSRDLRLASLRCRSAAHASILSVRRARDCRRRDRVSDLVNTGSVSWPGATTADLADPPRWKSVSEVAGA